MLFQPAPSPTAARPQGLVSTFCFNQHPAPPLLCLQGVYRSFVQNAKFVNAASVPHIHFMASCVVEMFGLDMAASYQQAFTGIRQLAVLLRGALAMRTKDAFREVYCSQTVKCLELWAKVLAAHADKQVSQLKPVCWNTLYC